MEEDSTVNQFVDSLVLFDSIVNNPLLKNSNVILFLNKIDLLKEKLKRDVKLSDYIPYYHGIFKILPLTLEDKNERSEVTRFMLKEFTRKNTQEKRQM